MSRQALWLVNTARWIHRDQPEDWTRILIYWLPSFVHSPESLDFELRSYIYNLGIQFISQMKIWTDDLIINRSNRQNQISLKNFLFCNSCIYNFFNQSSAFDFDEHEDVELRKTFRQNLVNEFLDRLDSFAWINCNDHQLEDQLVEFSSESSLLEAVLSQSIVWPFTYDQIKWFV